MKRVLITGAHSYVGGSFETYAKKYYDSEFLVDSVDMVDGSWREKDFSSYDVVFHVAGIAHSDYGTIPAEKEQLYRKINTELAIETAKKAKEDGVGQFVFMSSAIIYGDSAPYGKVKRITADTKPRPSNVYGDSKWKAENGIRALEDPSFLVSVIRSPMIYGKGSKGNYPLLAKIAKKIPFFPSVQNERSILYIENLCEFICKIMIHGKNGIFWPQNAEYGNTSMMVKIISEVNGHRMVVCKAFNWIVIIASMIPGRIGRLTNKAFGNLSYDYSLSQYDFIYQVVDLKESVRRTEANG